MGQRIGSRIFRLFSLSGQFDAFLPLLSPFSRSSRSILFGLYFFSSFPSTLLQTPPASLLVRLLPFSLVTSRRPSPPLALAFSSLPSFCTTTSLTHAHSDSQHLLLLYIFTPSILSHRSLFLISLVRFLSVFRLFSLVSFPLCTLMLLLSLLSILISLASPGFLPYEIQKTSSSSDASTVLLFPLPLSLPLLEPVLFWSPQNSHER